MDAMVEALKPIIIFAMVLWGIETVVTMLIKGKTVESNLQVLCSRCNGSKGAKEPDAFY